MLKVGLKSCGGGKDVVGREGGGKRETASFDDQQFPFLIYNSVIRRSKPVTFARKQFRNVLEREQEVKGDEKEGAAFLERPRWSGRVTEGRKTSLVE